MSPRGVHIFSQEDAELSNSLDACGSKAFFWNRCRALSQHRHQKDLSSSRTKCSVLLASHSVTAVEAMADGGEVLLRRGGERHNTTRHAVICCTAKNKA